MPFDNLDPTLAAIARRHRRWLEKVGLHDRPWLILGSAPDPTIPPQLVRTHVRIDINNAGRTAQAMGLGRADLTVRARRKSWAEHPHIDTHALLWMHRWPGWLLRVQLLGKPYDHVGSIMSLTPYDRDAIVAYVAEVSPRKVGDLGKVTNGVAIICYALLLDIPEIVIAGISLSKHGHSYDRLMRARRQIDEDKLILKRLSSRTVLYTTESALANETTIKLW